VKLHYFLVKEDLKLLHDSYDVYYEPIIENNARVAIKVNNTDYYKVYLQIYLAKL
jgi:hypothetical protein